MNLITFPRTLARPLGVRVGTGGGGYSIAGIVYDADGTTVVQGATVELSEYSAVSAIDGSYMIEGIPPGTSGAMTCTKTGYSWTPIVVTEISESLISQHFTNAWYAGGGSLAACVGAYKAIGAASLAASYVNIITPGTADAYVGVGKVAPTLGANGWVWDGVTTQQMLRIDAALSETTCIIASVGTTGAGGDGNGRLFQYIGGGRLVVPQNASSQSTWTNTNTLVSTPVTSTDEMCQAGKKIFINGVLQNTHNAGAVSDTGLTIGNQNAGSRQLNGFVQSFAIYSSLTDIQVAMIGAGMANFT